MVYLFFKATEKIKMKTRNFEETKKTGEKFAEKLLGIKNLKKAKVIVLYGDLGSGKTTFVQGFAKGLGIKKRIISPTFVIVRSYELRIKNKELRSFYHIDLYRVRSEDEIKNLGFEEIINDPENIVAVEWGEKLGNLLPGKRWDIRFNYVGETKRKIAINELT